MINIKSHVINTLFEYAKEAFPIEACGYLTGNDGIVDEAIVLKNIANSPFRFAMDPDQQLQVIRNVRKQRKQVIACFHSHPRGPAVMSQEDIKLAYDKSISYLIVSISDKDKPIGSFRVDHSGVYEEDVKIC